MTVPAQACHFSKPAWRKLGNCVRITNLTTILAMARPSWAEARCR
jgi:hypothetical protein